MEPRWRTAHAIGSCEAPGRARPGLGERSGPLRCFHPGPTRRVLGCLAPNQPSQRESSKILVNIKRCGDNVVPRGVPRGWRVIRRGGQGPTTEASGGRLGLAAATTATGCSTRCWRRRGGARCTQPTATPTPGPPVESTRLSTSARRPTSSRSTASLASPCAHAAEILARSVRHGASNGPTEAVNLVVKNVLRVAHGIRSVRNFRLRVPAARIRGRDAPFVAPRRCCRRCRSSLADNPRGEALDPSLHCQR